MALGNTINLLHPPDRSTPPIQTEWNEALIKNLHSVLGRMSQEVTATVNLTEITSFETKAELEAATVPLIVPSVRLTGYATNGDGGDALYVRVGSEPSHELKVQSSDGAWWELVPDASGVNVLQAGAKGDGTTNDSTAFTNAIAAFGSATVPANTYNLDTMISLTVDQSLQLEAGAKLQRVSAASSTEPVIWLKGNFASLSGEDFTSIIKSEKDAPNGVVRLGHKDLTESHANVQNCRIRNVYIQGATQGGRTTGAVDQGLALYNPLLSSFSSFFHQITNVAFRDTNTAIGLHGAANANYIRDIFMQKVGNNASDTYRKSIHINGALENTITSVFHHSSTDSLTTYVEILDNTGNGGIVHTPNYNDIRAIISEQGGSSAKSLIVVGTIFNNTFRIKTNTAFGATLPSDFNAQNILIENENMRGGNAVHNTLTADDLISNDTTVLSGIALPTSVDKRSTVVAATIPANVNHIRTTGYTSNGDGGGALYVRIGSEPSHEFKVSSNGGTIWWEGVVENGRINPRAIGGTSDQASAQKAFDYAVSEGSEEWVVVFSGDWTINSTVTISDPQDITVDARGANFTTPNDILMFDLNGRADPTYVDNESRQNFHWEGGRFTCTFSTPLKATCFRMLGFRHTSLKPKHFKDFYRDIIFGDKDTCYIGGYKSQNAQNTSLELPPWSRNGGNLLMIIEKIHVSPGAGGGKFINSYGAMTDCVLRDFSCNLGTNADVQGAVDIHSDITFGLSAQSGTFVDGEVVTGAASGATCLFREIYTHDFAFTITQHLVWFVGENRSSATFNAGENLTAPSGATATIGTHAFYLNQDSGWQNFKIEGVNHFETGSVANGAIGIRLRDRINRGKGDIVIAVDAGTCGLNGGGAIGVELQNLGNVTIKGRFNQGSGSSSVPIKLNSGCGLIKILRPSFFSTGEIDLNGMDSDELDLSDFNTIYPKVSSITGFSIISGVEVINTAGYAAAGDGGAGSYKRVGSEPSHALKVQSNDNAWWELVPDSEGIDVRQAGAKGDDSTDDATAINNALAATALNSSVVLPQGIHLVGGALTGTDGPFMLIGRGWQVDGDSNVIGGSVIKADATDVTELLTIQSSTPGDQVATQQEGVIIKDFALFHRGSGRGLNIDNITRAFVTNLHIDCNNEGAIGLHTNNWGFFSTFEKLYIDRFTDTGLQLGGQGSQHIVRDCHIQSSNASAVAALEIRRPDFLVSGGQYNVNLAGNTGIGIHVNNTGTVIQNGGRIMHTICETDIAVKITGTNATPKRFHSVVIGYPRWNMAAVTKGVIFDYASNCVLLDPEVQNPGSGTLVEWTANSIDCGVVCNHIASRSLFIVDSSATRPWMRVTGLLDTASRDTITTDPNLTITVENVEFLDLCIHNGTAWDKHIETIADDGVLSITPNKGLGTVLITSSGDGEDYILARYKISATGETVSLVVGGNGNIVTGDTTLTGTEGVDLKINLSSDSASGKIYINNRTGTSKIVFVTFTD